MAAPPAEHQQGSCPEEGSHQPALPKRDPPVIYKLQEQTAEECLEALNHGAHAFTGQRREAERYHPFAFRCGNDVVFKPRRLSWILRNILCPLHESILDDPQPAHLMPNKDYPLPLSTSVEAARRSSRVCWSLVCGLIQNVRQPKILHIMKAIGQDAFQLLILKCGRLYARLSQFTRPSKTSVTAASGTTSLVHFGHCNSITLTH